MNEVDARADPCSKANCGSDYSGFAARAIRLCGCRARERQRTSTIEQRIPIRKLSSFMVAPLDLAKFSLAEYCSPNCVGARIVGGVP